MLKKKKYIIFSIFETVRHTQTFFDVYLGQTCTVSRIVMICIKTQHFRFNQILLLTIGLWPYNERTRLVQLQITLVFGILISSVVYQVHPAIKYLLDELQHICNDLKDEYEIAIITKYGNIAKRLTAIIMCKTTFIFHVCNISTTFLLTISLYFLDAVLLANESESHRVMQKILPKFFIGRESYMYLILLHFFGAACTGGTVLVGTGMMLVTYSKHACGMFRIASYRIEKAMMVNVENISLKNEIIIRKEIIHAVDIHRKAVKYNGRWYVTSLHVQRLILFLLQNGSKTFRVSLGGVLSLSIELFATVKKITLYRCV
ncbi:uncharacterized protein [Temnothorax nylanderi]|uniref:uncharacterized protein n=1 Tax=Temnothorax nylanderi TaxID=102681 RepID=UPI003A869FB4